MESATLVVAVAPRSSVDRVGPWDGVLAVRVTRPPGDDDANRAVIDLVARALDFAPSWIVLVSGRRGRTKRLRVDGIDAGELDARLARLAD